MAETADHPPAPWKPMREAGSPLAQARNAHTRLVMLAPFPPPLAGAHKNSALIRAAIEDAGSTVISLQTGVPQSRAHQRATSHLIRKVLQSFRNTGRLFGLFGTASCAYLVPDGGKGIWISAMYSLALRVTQVPRVVVHYRNYSFFRRTHPAMAALAKLLGDRATHVFLDETMQEIHQQLYGRHGRPLIVSNAATCDVTPSMSHEPRAATPIRIGYLSNLTKEKGFDTVVAAFIQLAQLDHGLMFSVGGNPVGPSEVQLLDELRTALGPRLTYLGQIVGAEKQAFYESLDVFVFPTVYQQEAQPNVIFEALAAGNIVIATRHAAIPGMFGAARHVLIEPQSENLVGDTVAAVQKVAAEIQEPATRQSARNLAVTSFLSMQAAARAQYAALIELLTNR